MYCKGSREGEPVLEKGTRHGDQDLGVRGTHDATVAQSKLGSHFNTKLCIA